jgi:hypothetical protein
MPEQTEHERTERTEHGRRRHLQGDRPTREAFRDRGNPREIYHDRETGYWVYVGLRGRTHIFTVEGKHHTSFRTTKRGRQQRVQSGRWVRVKPGE